MHVVTLSHCHVSHCHTVMCHIVTCCHIVILSCPYFSLDHNRSMRVIHLHLNRQSIGSSSWCWAWQWPAQTNKLSSIRSRWRQLVQMLIEMDGSADSVSKCKLSAGCSHDLISKKAIKRDCSEKYFSVAWWDHSTRSYCLCCFLHLYKGNWLENQFPIFQNFNIRHLKIQR